MFIDKKIQNLTAGRGSMFSYDVGYTQEEFFYNIYIQNIFSISSKLMKKCYTGKI